jgi:hypothetical protein
VAPPCPVTAAPLTEVPLMTWVAPPTQISPHFNTKAHPLFKEAAQPQNNSLANFFKRLSWGGSTTLWAPLPSLKPPPVP